MSRLENLSPKDREALGRALRTLVDEAIGDFVYTIRDKEGKGWDGPRVTAWSEACEAVERFAPDPDPETLKQRAVLEVRRAELEAERKRIDEELEGLGGEEVSHG